jgi:diguanylate cyclase (GGDEF)-like protein/PAS domain S-box-containing protein
MVASRPHDDSVEQGLRAVLSRNPTAAIAAVGADTLFIDVPEDLLAYGHQQINARWSLDIVAESERETIIALWQRSTQAGAAHTAITLRDGSHGTMHLFETTPWRGCAILVVVPGANMRFPDVEASAPVVIRPRYALAYRDERGNYCDVDDTVCALLRSTPEELTSGAPLDFIHPDDHNRAVDNWIEMVSAKGAPRRYRARHRCGDDTWLWIEFTNHLRTREDGSIGIVSEMVDVSEEMAMHEALRASEEFLRRLTSSLPVAVGQIDPDGAFVYVNDRLATLLGSTMVRTQDDLLAIVAPDHRKPLRAALSSVFRDGADLDLEVRTMPPDSTTARVHRAGLCALRDGVSVIGALLSLTDVTESADLREALHRRATYDDLTGLHNRASIMMLLENSLETSRALGTGTAVVFVDLDRFKGINDQLGHAVGDDVLVRVARRLRSAVRRQDLVGRIGGDEFLVVCPEVGDPSVALEVAERVGYQLADDLEIAGTKVRSCASIGVAWAADQNTTPETLIRAADAAMYQSKRSGVGRPVVAGLVV